MRANEKCFQYKPVCPTRPPCPPPCPPCPNPWEEYCKACHKYCGKNRCKPPCRHQCWYKGDQDENGNWLPADLPGSSCGSCWAFGQTENDNVREDADNGQMAADDDSWDDAHIARKQEGADLLKESGMIVPKDAAYAREHAASLAYTQDGIWVYYPKSIWTA